MQKVNIKKVILDYIGENASEEQKQHAIEFAEYLEAQPDLWITLTELKTKYERELNESIERITSRRKKLLFID